MGAIAHADDRGIAAKRARTIFELVNQDGCVEKRILEGARACASSGCDAEGRWLARCA